MSVHRIECECNLFDYILYYIFVFYLSHQTYRCLVRFFVNMQSHGDTQKFMLA